MVNIWFKAREDKTYEILLTLSEINLENQVAGKLARDFLIDETINPEFHKKKTSQYLISRNDHVRKIMFNLATLRNAREIESAELTENIERITTQFDKYELLFKKTIQLIEERGFKDYGLEGEMRQYIHAIENVSAQYNLDMGKLLMVRRHEKDFIIRKEKKYTEKIAEAIQELRQDIATKVKNTRRSKPSLRSGE
ncbi:MAG: hypothetical protein HC880_16415 [Bacteroidia bacterium]|nr:hypothetical protein [Bacteroidia bacterium]